MNLHSLTHLYRIGNKGRDMTKEIQTRTVFEPFKIKSVEPIPILSIEERMKLIKENCYNLFFLPSSAVTFDFLTDSGTGAMSSEQWAAIMRGDESYAGSDSFKRFEQVVQETTGMEHIIPTHQGRAAEFLTMKTLVKEGDIVIGNTHFDTTRANIEMSGAEALDMPFIAEDENYSFKGNMDLEKLSAFIKEHRSKIPMVILTITNNSVGGQPVSMENIAQTAKIVKDAGILFFLDIARFAENAFFIKQRETGFENKTIEQIALQQFSYADGVMMSAKKDGFGNIGGFIALRDTKMAKEIRSLMVLTEGFPTYGGLAGRDLDALAVGLREILDENYLTYRTRSVEYFARGIEDAGLKVVTPVGGHAVYVDAGASLPHLKPLDFPGQSLSIAMYEHLGIRGVEVGSVMLGKKDKDTGEEIPAPKELVRFAMPRRVYTQSHIDYIIEVLSHVAPQFKKLPGYKITKEPPFLRHFNAHFAPK